LRYRHKCIAKVQRQTRHSGEEVEYVERCHRTMGKEFYQVRDYLPLVVHKIRKYIELDDCYYNNIRPDASP
jgi:hypothetical protein